MRKRTLVIIIFSLAAVFLCHTDLFAQPPQSKCSQITYSPSGVSLQKYRLDRIEGQAPYASPSQKGELGPANGVCVALFNRKNGLATSVTADDKGQFEFPHMAPQDYVLIAFAGDLQKL